MDSSRRAVEAYWRSRMIEGVTSDEDKIAAVYKLEEVCELLRSSHVSIVKEVSEYVLKRLDHKSPIVKQKALRLIKYAVGKSGTEFRREMQRHSVALRQLVHYKGQLDPLKGDTLNKSVRETAQEAISIIFASDDSKASAPAEGINNRIQGFGNTNFEMPTEEKKSFLSEVVGLGSASLKQGLSTIVAAHSMRKAEGGTYKSPTLRRSLTTEIDAHDYEGGNHHREILVSSGVSKNPVSGTWNPNPETRMTSTGEDSGSSHTGVKSREERLLDTIVTSGGVRLQPTREAIQSFFMEASKLDAVSMSHALEMKLQSHLWQVRMKAICILESVFRKKDDEYCLIIASYFSENKDAIVKCSELPQVSLREKANKVLNLLDGDETSVSKRQAESSDTKEKPVPVPMPNLIDTGDDLDDYGTDTSPHDHVEQRTRNSTLTGPLVDNLFGIDPTDSLSTTEDKSEVDPFADVSFHMSETKEQEDIFSGLNVDDTRSGTELHIPVVQKPEFLDIFSDNSHEHASKSDQRNTNDLMADLTLNGMPQENNQQMNYGAVATNGGLNSLIGSNALYPLAPMQYSIPPSIMLNQAFATQQMNYGAMGALFAQQQLYLQNIGNLNSGFGVATGNTNGGYSSEIPDIFHLSNSQQVHSQGTVANNSKKEETKAFDFIADHLSATRDLKRVA